MQSNELFQELRLKLDMAVNQLGQSFSQAPQVCQILHRSVLRASKQHPAQSIFV